MKLVIDITEKQYEIAKEYVETVDDENLLANAIVNGVPYEPATEFADRCRECRREKVLDKIRDEIEDNTYFINEITEKEGIDFETVEKIIDKYRVESEEV